MKNVALFIMLGVLVFGLTACTKKVDEGTATKKKRHEAGKSHGKGSDNSIATAKTPIADSMKKMKLNGYQSKTVGEAFDAYSMAVAREWQEVYGRDNRYYVDYICWFDEKSVLPEHRKQAIVKRGIDIKFVVLEGGKAEGEAYIAMATKLFMKADGKIQSEFFKVEEVPNIVKAIYENKNVEF